MKVAPSPCPPRPLPDPKLPETGSVFELTQALRQEQEEQQRAEVARQQQHLQEQQRQETRQQQQRRASLSRQAQAWLQGLDPHSEEGLWFEEFSYAYESKLEAAIDYLEALREARA
ncbi:MAG: hypothetical protein HC890_12920 [Chloroflexaceae bacterium]|nr:hypothetical protein [Chloroflexaceae bacterium]